MNNDCVFCKIAEGIIPSKRLYENDDFVVINDLHPQAAMHYLAIPKVHFAGVNELNEDTAALVGRVLKTIGAIAEPVLGLTNGFRLVINKGEAARQSVFHLHIHILGDNETPLSDKMA